MKNTSFTNIKLTNNQLFVLAKAVYIANWIANANSVEVKHKDFESLENLIFTYLKDSKFKIYSEKFKNKYFPNGKFEMNTNVQGIIDEFKEEEFWNEIVERLAKEELLINFTPKEISEMDRADYWDKTDMLENKYNTEVIEYGLSRLKIDVKKKVRNINDKTKLKNIREENPSPKLIKILKNADKESKSPVFSTAKDATKWLKKQSSTNI